MANPWLLRTKALMLLTPSPEYLHREMRITPEMVSEMAAKVSPNPNPNPIALALSPTLTLTLTL